MIAYLCGQSEILPGECVECGGSLHAGRRSGYPGQCGQVCSEDCAAAMSDRLAVQAASDHLRVRDLLCDCATCAQAGHPTEAERAEYAAYLTEHPAGER